MLDRTADWGARTPYGSPGAVERLAAALPGCMRDVLPTKIGRGSPWPVRVDTYLEDGFGEDDVDAWVPAVSALGSGGDGLDIAVCGNRVVGVRGRAADRVNHGRLDPRERHGRPQPGRHTGRLTRPLVREGGELVETTWDAAMARIVDRSRELLSRPGGWGRFGFHTGSRLFLEEYYTLAVIAKAGIGTPHMDGDTRLTASASAALAASFGVDAPPGSYADVDHCDAIALWGLDPAGTHPVLWERILDRRLGPDPPALIVVDPQETQAALEADVRLAIRPGTNVALMNGLLHELLARHRYDPAYVERHTVGLDELRRVVDAYPGKRVAEICGVPEELIERAVEIIGRAERLLSAVGPGFHRSNQATIAACQVHNLHLLRGMIGRPGAGVLHLGGGFSARNALETGATGGLPGLRNWANPRHVRELADLWGVDPAVIPCLGPPTHTLRLFRYAEEGSIGLLWITASDPARWHPGLGEILDRDDVFVVVQDLCLTETARHADVVLPAAGWGEKLGVVTGADRTVHLCGKAVDPPGEARPDLDIFLDYARRMGFRTRDGAPLIGWSDPESAFEAWKACSKGRPCDYSGLSYERLRRGAVPSPCTPGEPHGTERLYAGGRFPTGRDHCQTYGFDLVTGAEHGPERYREIDPDGRAFLHAAHYETSPEVTGDDHPLLLTTVCGPGVPATPGEPWAEVHPRDAEALGLGEGDPVWIESRRGGLRARARPTGTRPGVVVLLAGSAHAPAVASLTAPAWDPIARQPISTAIAVRMTKVAGEGVRGGERAGVALSPDPVPIAGAGVPAAAGGPVAEASERLEGV